MLRIGDIKGVEIEVPRASVEEMRPAQLSLMPEGLPKAIGPERMRDLMTFLLLAEPGVLEPGPIEQPGAPPPRTRAEVGELLRDCQAGRRRNAQAAWTSCWFPDRKITARASTTIRRGRSGGRSCLVARPRSTVEKADPWPSAEQWKSADVVVMFSANPAWTPERAKDLDAFFARGGGLVLLHFAVNGQRAPEEYARRIGLAWNPSARSFATAS